MYTSKGLIDHLEKTC